MDIMVDKVGNGGRPRATVLINLGAIDTVERC